MVMLESGYCTQTSRLFCNTFLKLCDDRFRFLVVIFQVNQNSQTLKQKPLQEAEWKKMAFGSAV